MSPECEYCGKSENLVNFDGLLYCEGFCLDEAKEAARIDDRDKQKEEARLTQGLRKWRVRI